MLNAYNESLIQHGDVDPETKGCPRLGEGGRREHFVQVGLDAEGGRWVLNINRKVEYHRWERGCWPLRQCDGKTTSLGDGVTPPQNIIHDKDGLPAEMENE